MAALAGCSVQRPPQAPTAPVATPATPQPPATTHAPKGGAAEGAKGQVLLGPPRTVRNMVELRQQAAERLVAANPGRVYLGEVPDVLLAIPVLEIELNANGTVRKIAVLRRPGQAIDTLQLAIDAVHRAAPFGDVSRLPRPWKFNETFLFNDHRQFKPRTLDQ